MRTNFTRCSFCCGAGKLMIRCPASHHNHDITISCGRCGGTGFAAPTPPSPWMHQPGRRLPPTPHHPTLININAEASTQSDMPPTHELL